MTLFYGNPNQDMNERALRFLGAFSHIQICIDEMLAKTFFEKRIPKAARVVWKRTVGRIRDDERVDLFQAIAADLGFRRRTRHLQSGLHGDQTSTRQGCSFRWFAVQRHEHTGPHRELCAHEYG